MRFALACFFLGFEERLLESLEIVSGSFCLIASVTPEIELTSKLVSLDSPRLNEFIKT